MSESGGSPVDRYAEGVSRFPTSEHVADTRPPTPTMQRLASEARAHEIALAALQRQASPPEHSLDLIRNAKGDVQIGLTVRGHDLDAVLESGQASFDLLRAKYPHSSEAPAPGLTDQLEQSIAEVDRAKYQAEVRQLQEKRKGGRDE